MRVFMWSLAVLAWAAGPAFSQESHEDGTSSAAAHAGEEDHPEVGHDLAEIAHDTEHGSLEHGEEGHAAPPLSEDLAIWSILAFAGFCFAIHKLGIWQWMLVSMADRENQEHGLIDVAEGHLAAAQSSLKQYRGQLEAMDETVAETLAEAGRDADYTRTEIVELANREAQQMVQRAEVEIGRARDHSLHQLFEHLAARVSEAAEARVRERLQGEDQDRLIEETLNQLAAS